MKRHYPNILIAFLSFLGGYASVSAQSIENVRFMPHENKVLIVYDIVDAQPGQLFEISVYSSMDDYTHPLKTVSGNGVGKNIKAGVEKKIFWHAGEDLQLKELKVNEIDFEVLGMIQEDSIGLTQEEIESFIKEEREDSIEWAIKNTLELDSAEQKKHPLKRDDKTPKPPKLHKTLKTTLDKGAVPEMVEVHGGLFRMGNKKGEKDEQPTHIVKLNPFFISKYEITNMQFAAFLNAVGKKIGNIEEWVDLEDPDCQIEYVSGLYKAEKGFENYPVIEVNWFGANQYCQWAGGRLPTEAEWEYAANGGHHRHRYIFSGSNHIDKVAWYSENSDNATHEVGQKKPNGLGIYDLSGNVWEWCADWYGADYYGKGHKVNPQGPLGTKHKVIRGGSWGNYDMDAGTSRRGRFPPDDSNNSLGFRMAKSIR